MDRYLNKPQGLKSPLRVSSSRVAWRSFSNLPSSRNKSTRVETTSLGTSLLVLRIQRQVIIYRSGSYFQMQIRPAQPTVGMQDMGPRADYKYENRLLAQRNKILSLENEALVDRVQQLEGEVSAMQAKIHKVQREIQYYTTNREKQMGQMTKLVSNLNANISSAKNIGCYKIIMQMLKNQCETHTILGVLSELVSQSTSDNKQNRSSSDLNRLRKMLERRQQKIQHLQHRNREIIHIVKQPSWKHADNNDSQMAFIVRITQKLVRKVKKQAVGSESINKIFSDIGNYIRLRKDLKEQQKMLQVRERQLELGVGSAVVLEHITQALTQLTNQQMGLKQQLQRQIGRL